jgi:hypothetical protein
LGWADPCPPAQEGPRKRWFRPREAPGFGPGVLIGPAIAARRGKHLHTRPLRDRRESPQPARRARRKPTAQVGRAAGRRPCKGSSDDLSGAASSLSRPSRSRLIDPRTLIAAAKFWSSAGPASSGVAERASRSPRVRAVASSADPLGSTRRRGADQALSGRSRSRSTIQRPPQSAGSEAGNAWSDTSSRTSSRLRHCRPRHRQARLGDRYRFSVRRDADGAFEPDGHWTRIDGKHVADPARGLATSRISKRAIITGIVSKAYLDRLALDHDQHHAAVSGLDQPSREALDIFCAMLGGFAGNLALTYGARGGVYIAGGIAPRMLDFLANSEFRRRFEKKGRLAAYLKRFQPKSSCTLLLHFSA